MENSIVSSHFKLVGTSFGNGNVYLDFGAILIILLIIAIVFLAISILVFVNYKRDKDNIPSLHKIEKKIDFYSLDFIRINNRLEELEDKSGNIDELHKSILELKSLIKRRKNVKN